MSNSEAFVRLLSRKLLRLIEKVHWTKKAFFVMRTTCIRKDSVVRINIQRVTQEMRAYNQVVSTYDTRYGRPSSVLSDCDMSRRFCFSYTNA